jgi:hypothetical protein
MKSPVFAASTLCAAVMLMTTSAWGYKYCGAHDRRHEMRAYYFNSEFWVNILAEEERKWNLVHSVLSINRERSPTFPAKLGDGQNVIGWLREADLLRLYNRTWGQALAVTFTLKERNCGRVLETDLIFNPAITLFTPQTAVPYSLGFQEAALHELGHVLTLGHEDGSLSLMATAPTVSDVLHHNEKVGWSRSAAQRFNPLPAPIMDMGVFPLRKGPGIEIYASLSPTTVSRGANVTINDFSVENLSSQIPFSNPKYRVILENVASGVATEIGWFAWTSFNPFSGWSGNLTYRVPGNVPPATYRVVAEFTGQDGDRTNDRAVFGTIDVW